jgi:DNA-binding IclR family transcriptional regulator
MRVWPPGQRRSASRSATRALDVLEYFGQVRRPLRAIEIGRALSLRPSTTNQLLKTMVESAHLTFDAATKSYSPSPRLAHFCAWMMQAHGADEQLRSLICDVQAACGETVTLTTPNGLFMQIVDFAVAPDVAQGVERGLRVSIFGSTIGSAYLSTLPDADVIALASRARIAAADLADILTALARMRREGVADGGSEDGAMWSVAAPIAAREALAPMVIGVAGPVERMQAKLAAIRTLLRQAARRARTPAA